MICLNEGLISQNVDISLCMKTHMAGAGQANPLKVLIFGKLLEA